MSVVVLGLNQRTVSLDLLERMTIPDTHLAKSLADLCGRPNLSEAVVLSTCMRTEIYVQPERFHGAVGDVQDFLSDVSGTRLDQFIDHVYCYYEDGAVSHLFEVAAGIDSAVIGETEVLAQVRKSWERAREEKAAGPVLSNLFRHAVEVGKRARAETGISRGITSVAHAAVALAEDRLGGSLAGRSILVVGVGDMGEGMAAALASYPRVGRVMVANRTRSRASELASRIGGEDLELANMSTALRQADILLTSASAPSVLLEAGDLEPIMAGRSDRPLLVVDVGVPRNVDRAVASIEGVTLLDMDDLLEFAEAGMEGRRREVATVRAIIAEELGKYLEQAAAREAAPLVSALRDRAERVRQSELARFKGRLDSLDPKQRQAVEALTEGMLNKLLHEPTVRLKEAAGSPRGERLAEAVRALFEL